MLDTIFDNSEFFTDNNSASTLVYHSMLYNSLKNINIRSYSRKKLLSISSNNINHSIIKNTNNSVSIFGPSYSYENSKRSPIRSYPRLK